MAHEFVRVRAEIGPDYCAVCNEDHRHSNHISPAVQQTILNHPELAEMLVRHNLLHEAAAKQVRKAQRWNLEVDRVIGK